MECIPSAIKSSKTPKIDLQPSLLKWERRIQDQQVQKLRRVTLAFPEKSEHSRVATKQGHSC